MLHGPLDFAEKSPMAFESTSMEPSAWFVQVKKIKCNFCANEPDSDGEDCETPGRRLFCGVQDVLPYKEIVKHSAMNLHYTRIS